MLEQLGLGIVLTLEDNFTPQANTAMNSMVRLQNQAEGMSSNIKSSLDNLHHVMLSGFSLTTLGDDIQKEGMGILNTFKNITGAVTKTGKEFETIRSTMKVFFDDYQDAVKWGTNLASTTPFEIKDVMESMTAFKAIGIDVRNEIEAVGKAGEKMSKSLMEYIGDLGALRPDQGLQGALMAIRELAGGNSMSFKRRFDIDPEGLLGRPFADASTNIQQFEKDLAELSAKLAPNLMGSLLGTMEQEVSNLKDTWEIFKLSIADAGAFDAVKQTIRAVSNALGNIDMESTGKAISEVISTLWKPVDLLVRGLGKLVQGGLKFIETFPGLSKSIGIFIGIYGVVTTLTGGIMKLAGKFIILASSITSAYLNFQMFAGTNVMATLSPLIGGFKTLISTIGGVTLGIAGLTLAWNTNFLGIRDVGVSVANELGNRWSMANSIIKNGLQDFKEMTLNDDQLANLNAHFNVNFQTSDEATSFLDKLQQKAMVIARPLSVLGSLWTALFGKKNEDGMVIFSDSQIQALRDTGMLTTVQTLVALRGRVEAFFTGFKEGAKSFIGVMKEFMNFVLTPIKPLIEGVRKVIDPVVNSFKNLFGITDDEGMDLTKAEKQIAMMEKLGKAVGFVVGTFAGFKVVKGLTKIITKPFSFLSKSIDTSSKKLSGILTKFNNIKPFSKKTMAVDVEEINGGKTGLPPKSYMGKNTPASRKAKGYNYIDPNFVNKADPRLKGVDTTNVYGKKRMFGLGGTALYTRNADGTMKNLGSRGGIFGKYTDKAKDYHLDRTRVANGAKNSDLGAYGARAKKKMGQSIGTLRDYYDGQASAKAKGSVQTMVESNKRDSGIVNKYRNGDSVAGSKRKSYDGMWNDIEKDTGMYYSDFGKGKQGELERTRFVENYMRDKETKQHSKKDMRRAYSKSYNAEMNNLLGDNAKYADADVYKKKRSGIGSLLFGDKYQVAETNKRGVTKMNTVAKTDGILSPMINPMANVTQKFKPSNVMSGMKEGITNKYRWDIAPRMTGVVDSVEGYVGRGASAVKNSVKNKAGQVGGAIANSTVGQKVSGAFSGVSNATSNAYNSFKGTKVGGALVNGANYTRQSMGQIGSFVANSSMGQGVGAIKNSFKNSGFGSAIKNTVTNPFGAIKGAIADPKGAMGKVGSVGKGLWGATKTTAGVVGSGIKGVAGGAMNVAKKGVGMAGAIGRGALGMVGKAMPWAMAGSMIGQAVSNTGANLGDDRKNELINKSANNELPVKLTADSSNFDMGLAHITDKVKNTNFGDAFKNLATSGGQTLKLIGGLLKTTFEGFVQSAPQIFSMLWSGIKSGADTLITVLPELFNKGWNWITTSGVSMFGTFLTNLQTVYFPQAIQWISDLFSKGWTWITTDGATLLGEFTTLLTTKIIPGALEFIQNGFSMAWNWVTTDGIALLSSFVGWLASDALPMATGLLVDGFKAIWNWVKDDGIKGLLGFFSWIITDGVPKMLEMAGQLGSSLMNGLASAIDKLGSVLWGAVKSAFVGAIRFALPKVLEDPVLEALGLPTHHGGLYMSPMEHMALIRKDETVLPPDKSKQLDGLLNSGATFNPVVSNGVSEVSLNRESMMAMGRSAEAPTQSTTTPVVSRSRADQGVRGGNQDNSVTIQNLEIKLDAKNLSRSEAREQALMIMEEIKKINKERVIRQYS